MPKRFTPKEAFDPESGFLRQKRKMEDDEQSTEIDSQNKEGITPLTSDQILELNLRKSRERNEGRKKRR